ncbi:hypothetical protein TcWFU_002742, partial [Taenia crassiceps]
NTEAAFIHLSNTVDLQKRSGLSTEDLRKGKIT